MFFKNLILQALYLLIRWVRSRYFFASALLLVSFYKFLDIAWNVHTKDKITLYDEWIVRIINHFATPIITQLFVFITEFGGVNILLTFWAITTGLLLFYRRWKDGLLVTASILGGTVLMFALKDLFQRARPVLGAPILREHGYSFPSGHSTVSMCFYGILIYLVFRYCKTIWLKLLITFVLALVILIVGLSRVYLGVHYPSDALAGWLLGLFWIALCVASIFAYSAKTPERTSAASAF